MWSGEAIAVTDHTKNLNTLYKCQQHYKHISSQKLSINLLDDWSNTSFHTPIWQLSYVINLNLSTKASGVQEELVKLTSNSL